MFPVGVGDACRDPRQQDVSRGTQQGDVIELGVEVSLIGLASGDEQSPVPVIGQQAGDGILTPDPVRGPVGQGDPPAPLVGVCIHDAVTALAQHLQRG
jgi:hypothetical protein